MLGLLSEYFTFWISPFAQQTAITHWPQGVIIVRIYMCSNIYYLLLQCLSRKVLCRRIGVETFKRDIYAKLPQLDFCKPTRLHHSFFL